jgi:hypothetical protein
MEKIVVFCVIMKIFCVKHFGMSHTL